MRKKLELRNIHTSQLVLMVALQFSDFMSTYIFTEASKGNMKEGNPVFKKLVENGGWKTLFGIKAGFCAGASIYSLRYFKKNPRAATGELAGGNILMGFVVLWNLANTADFLAQEKEKQLKKEA